MSQHNINYRRTLRSSLRNRKLADALLNAIYDLQVFTAANGGSITENILEADITVSSNTPYPITSVQSLGAEDISSYRKIFRSQIANKNVADQVLNILLELQEYSETSSAQETSVVSVADISVKEITDITTIAAGGVKEITQLICLAESSIKEVTQIVADSRTNTADGEYFDITSQSGTTFRVYMDTTGASATIPAADGNTLTEVDISGVADTAAGSGDAVAAVLNALGDFVSPATGTGTILVTDANYGIATDAVNGNLGNAWAISNSVQGVDSNLNGEYFVLQEDAGSVAFWIDVDDSGTGAPITGATRNVEITTVASEDAIGAVGTAIYNAIIGDGGFEAGVDGAAGTITVQCATFGPRVDSVDEDTGFTITEDTAGAGLDGVYFTLQDDAGSVAFWIDLDDSGTLIPSGASTADRTVEITTVTNAMTDAQVGTAIYNAVVGDGEFEAGSNDAAGNLTIQCATFGARVDGADGDTGFTISENTTGAGLDGSYFILEDVAGTVAFWIDTDNSGTTMPAGAAAADRAVELITVTNGMTKAQVGTAIYTEVIADSKFAAGSDDLAGNLVIAHADTGCYGAVAAGTSGFTVTISNHGSTGAAQAELVTANVTAGASPYSTDIVKALSSAFSHKALAEDFVAMILELQTEYRDNKLGTCSGTLTNDLIATE